MYVVYVRGTCAVKDRRDSRDSAASVYEKDFAPTFLKESEAFYKAEATRLLDSCNAMQYLKKVSGSLVCKGILC